MERNAKWFFQLKSIDMIPSKFTYIKAKSVEEALSLLQQHGDEARLLAGGHSLIPALKLRLNDYKYLIDISKIADLQQIEEKDGQIHIGAMVTHGAIVDSSLIQQKLSFFSQAADLIGDVQVRNLGTIGGSIAHADPSADWPALLLAGDAHVHVQSATGSRSIAAEDFFLGIYATAIEEGEIITSIGIPVREGARSTYVKFMQPASRFAIVGCAAIVGGNGHADDVRVAFTGVSATPFRDKEVEAALEGQSLSDEAIEKASGKAAEGVSIMSDNYASEAYRKQMAKVYCRRALVELA